MFAVLTIVAPCGGQTQLGSGSLTGVVKDASYAVVEDAKVVVSSGSTGLRREAVTGPPGNFSVPVLPSGVYEVSVTKPGFKHWQASDVQVSVGGSASLNVVLQVGELAESVTVGATLSVDTVKTDESSLVDERAIQGLPINGRRADQFALLTPGVARDGRFGLLSYRGMSGAFNNYMIEGNDDNQAYFSEARGRTRIASNASANAIKEFQVGKGAFLAEFGRAAGGSINAVLRSGSNDFHGDGFWYFRNESLMARDPLAAIKPDEYRHQFGGSISGSIVRDHLFYFVNYDGQLRDFPLVITDTTNVLVSGRPVLPANPTPAQQATYDGDLQAFNRGVQEVLSKVPGGAFGNAQPRNQNQYNGIAKVDWNISEKHTLSTFYNHLHASGKAAIQTPIVLGNVGRNGTDDVRINAWNARLTSLLGSNKVNEFRFQWSRDFEFQFTDSSGPQVYVNGSGNFSFGTATFLDRPALPDERRLQALENFSWNIGRHAFKFGGEINRAFDHVDNPAQFAGVYTYTNALTFGRDLLDSSRRAYASYAQNFGLAGVDFTTWDLALFAQDQWRATPRLTINYGLRWDYQKLPDPQAPNAAVPETQHFNADVDNFGPRVGGAWDLRGNGRTVIRGGYGIYYARTPNLTIQNALAQTGLSDPSRATIALTLQPTDPTAPQYPNILAAVPSNFAGQTTVYRLAGDLERPRVQDVTIGVEHELFPRWVVAVSYMRAYANLMPLQFDVNLPAPQFERTYQFPDGSTFRVPFVAGITRTASGQNQSNNLSRPNPAFGAINVVRSLGKNWYNGMLVEIRRSFSGQGSFRLSYTLAKAENLSGSGDGGGGGAESIGPFTGARLANQFDLDSNRGTSPTDQRHRIVISGIWEPKWRPIRGFLLSGIYVLESGRPLAALVSGANLPFQTPDGTQWNGYGGLLGQSGQNFLPTIARNSYYGLWNRKLDLRLSRTFRITERLRVEGLAEAFNIFNTPNYTDYNTTIYGPVATAVTTPLSAPVQLQATAGYRRPVGNGAQPDGTNARRLQLALRFRF